MILSIAFNRNRPSVAHTLTIRFYAEHQAPLTLGISLQRGTPAPTSTWARYRYYLYMTAVITVVYVCVTTSYINAVYVYQQVKQNNGKESTLTT